MLARTAKTSGADDDQKAWRPQGVPTAGGRRGPRRRGPAAGRRPRAGAPRQPGHRYDQGRRARGDPDAGEPQLRPLLRDSARRARLRRSEAHHLAKRRARLEAARQGRRRHGRPLPFRHRRHPRRDPLQPRPQLEGQPRALEAPRRLDRGQGPPDHGLFHPRGPAVPLRAGRRVHGLRRLLLLDLRPDQPEPAVPVQRHQRAFGGRRQQDRGRQPDRGDQRDCRRGERLQDLQGPHLADLRRAAAGGRRLLAHLPGVRQLRRQRPGLLRQLPRA